MIANFGFQMSDEELTSLIKTYGNDKGEIMYLNFLDDVNPYKGAF